MGPLKINNSYSLSAVFKHKARPGGQQRKEDRNGGNPPVEDVGHVRGRGRALAGSLLCTNSVPDTLCSSSRLIFRGSSELLLLLETKTFGIREVKERAQGYTAGFKDKIRI